MPRDDKTKFTGKKENIGSKGFGKESGGKNVWETEGKVSSGDIKGKSGEFGKSSTIQTGKTGTSQTGTGTQGGFSKPETTGKFEKGKETGKGKFKKRAA